MMNEREVGEEIVTSESRPGDPRWKTWAIVATLVVAGCVALPMDVEISRFCLNDGTPGEIRRLLDRAEFFGHGYGVLGVVITVCVLSPRLRPCWVRLASCAMGAGLLTNLIKLSYQRTRPCEFDFHGGVAETFRGFSLASTENMQFMFRSAFQSVPSGHTATAVGLALGLGWLYPRGRTWFLILAALVAASRVDGGAHYVSDVFWGGACGYLVANSILYGRSSRWFDEFERRQATRNSNVVPIDSQRRVA